MQPKGQFVCLLSPSLARLLLHVNSVQTERRAAHAFRDVCPVLHILRRVLVKLLHVLFLFFLFLFNVIRPITTNKEPLLLLLLRLLAAREVSIVVSREHVWNVSTYVHAPDCSLHRCPQLSWTWTP